MSNWVNDFALPLLPSVIAVVGWWVVSLRESTTKKNNIHNRRVEVTTKLIDKIHDDAKRFYALGGSDGEASKISALILSDFKKLSSLIRLISKNVPKKNEQSLGCCYIEFKKVITGGEFETISRKIVPLSNQLYLDIDMAFNELFIELEEVFLI